MIDGIRAELLLLRRRTATWLLLAIAVVLSIFFNYVLPYSSLGSSEQGQRFTADLAQLLPSQFLASGLQGFPFFMGMLTLILGVLTAGGDYGWGTLKTTLVQQPNRLRLFAAKLTALALAVLLYTLVVLAADAISSFAVARLEGGRVEWPPLGDIVRGVPAGWLILSLWAILGVLLAVASRGTALALGLGIIYGLVVEGVITGFGANIAILQDAANAFLRTNMYSLLTPLVGRAEITAADNGPGAFSGPFVDPWQALGVIAGYLILFVAASGLILKRRDVS